MQVLALVGGKTAPKLQPAKDAPEPSLMPGDRGQMIFRKMSVAGLVNLMANLRHPPVVDRTGITRILRLHARSEPVRDAGCRQRPRPPGGFRRPRDRGRPRAARPAPGKAESASGTHDHRLRGETPGERNRCPAEADDGAARSP